MKFMVGWVLGAGEVQPRDVASSFLSLVELVTVWLLLFERAILAL